MRYPSLVPDSLCKVTCTITKQSGLNMDGTPKNSTVYAGKCFISEKSRQKLTADKQLITLSGEALFNGSICGDDAVIAGKLTAGGRTYKIYGSERAKNPDGSVNYTRLELI